MPRVFDIGDKLTLNFKDFFWLNLISQLMIKSYYCKFIYGNSFRKEKGGMNEWIN